MQIAVNGVNLNYEEYGVGQPLVLLHGNGEDLHIFDGMIELMAPHYHIFAIDSRGHGLSEWGDEPLSIPLLASDIEAFIVNKELDKVVLIGFSDGGNMALEIASRLGPVISKMVLIGANLYPLGVKFHILIQIWWSLIFGSETTRRYYRIMTHQPSITARKLSQITAHTLILAGENDMIRSSHTSMINRHIAGSRMLIINGGDHFLVHKKCEQITHIIESFIINS